MRKDEIQLLDNIDKLTLSQIYLLQPPHTPQQEFLHLYAHRTLVARKMFHRNLDRIRPRLQGTFAHTALQTAMVECLVENQVDCAEEESQLIDLIHGWVDFYPSLRSAKREKVLLADAVLQQGLDATAFGGYGGYLTYLNIISVDLWRTIRNKKNEQEFLNPRSLREELKEAILDKNGDRLDANDLLTFISGCIPKTLLNIILTKEGLPPSLKSKKSFECLYANQAIEYFLRKHVKLGLLLRQTLLLLVGMDISTVQQKFLMLVAMRYFYVYHFDRKYSASELVIHAFNKLTDEVKKSLSDEFSLFFKVILKLGKAKFTSFVAQNSPFARSIIDLVMRKPMIGYPQESANPYNSVGVAESIQIERGATAVRTFEVLEDYSIFYFKIQVLSLDITIRLFYLGEVGSNKQVKTLLFTHQKVEGELKTSVNAIRKGLYRFQFDNSFSWINGKSIKYQNEIFTPLEIKTASMDEWIDDFYGGVDLNQIANEEEIIVVENRKAEREETDAVATVDRRDGYLRVAVKRRGEEFVYETDSVERMVQRVNELAAAKEKYSWQIGNRTVQSLGELQSFIRGSLPEGKQEREEQQVQREEKRKEVISLDEYKEEGDEVEYEVAQREELQRSQIINESSANPTVVSEVQSPKKSGKALKETIDCSYDEMELAS